MWDWLTSEAGAAWTALVASWMLGIGVILYRRTRRHIVVREASRKAYAHIAPQAADRMTIFVDNEPVRCLEELVVSIRNSTARAICGPTVRIELPYMRKLISVRVQENPSSEMCSTTYRMAAEDALIVEPSFLNPHGDHGHEILVALLVDGEVDEWRLDGQGEGWSARRGLSMAHVRLLRVLVPFGAAFVGWGIMQKYFFADSEAGAWFSCVTFTVLSLAALAALAWIDRIEKRSEGSLVTAPDSIMSAGPAEAALPR